MSADEGNGLGARVRTRRERERLERLVRRRDHLRELARLGRANTYDEAEESALTWALDEIDRLSRGRGPALADAWDQGAKARAVADPATSVRNLNPYRTHERPAP